MCIRPFHRRAVLLRATVILISAAATIAVSAQSKGLRLVSTVWPPFTNVAGQPRFALDLVEAAFGRIGVTSETSFVEAAAYTAAVLAGPSDGSAAVWKDAAREKELLFSRPYLENRLILV